MSEDREENLDVEKIEENVEDDLKRLPSDRVQHVIERHSVSKSGPLPDPEDFRKYEEVHPGAADRILKIAENEQKHRHNMSEKDLKKYHNNNFKLTKFGMSTGLISSTIGTSGGVLIAIFGHSTSGIILALASILPVIVNAINSLFKKDVPPPSDDED